MNGEIEEFNGKRKNETHMSIDKRLIPGGKSNHPRKFMLWILSDGDSVNKGGGKFPPASRQELID